MYCKQFFDERKGAIKLMKQKNLWLRCYVSGKLGACSINQPCHRVGGGHSKQGLVFGHANEELVALPRHIQPGLCPQRRQSLSTLLSVLLCYFWEFFLQDSHYVFFLSFGFLLCFSRLRLVHYYLHNFTAPTVAISPAPLAQLGWEWRNNRIYETEPLWLRCCSLIKLGLAPIHDCVEFHSASSAGVPELAVNHQCYS
jgi:hypothetical protein